MELYGVKEVPDVIVKYNLYNGKQESIVFDCLKDYDICSDFGMVTIQFTCANDDFFTKFKKEILNNQIRSCLLNARNTRRNATTGEDEEYRELENLYCGAPFLSYRLSSGGEIANFILQFPIIREGEQ